jgi:hypothetical protein
MKNTTVMRNGMPSGRQRTPRKTPAIASKPRPGKIRPQLRLAKSVVGDTALALDRNGKPLPGLAAVAKQQGMSEGERAVVATW